MQYPESDFGLAGHGISNMSEDTMLEDQLFPCFEFPLSSGQIGEVLVVPLHFLQLDTWRQFQLLVMVVGDNCCCNKIVGP